MIELIRRLCCAWSHDHAELTMVLSELGDRLTDEESPYTRFYRPRVAEFARLELHLDRRNRVPRLLAIHLSESAVASLADLVSVYGQGKPLPLLDPEDPPRLLFEISELDLTLRFRLVATLSRTDRVHDNARVNSLTLETVAAAGHLPA